MCDIFSGKRHLFSAVIMALGMIFLVGCGSSLVPDAPKPVVTVFNGCQAYCSKVGVNGLARGVNKKLVESGYIVAEPKNLTNYKVETEILYNPSDEEAAKEIREIIGVGLLLSQEEMASGGVQVILGMDSVIPTFPTLTVEHYILVLNSTTKRGLAKDMKVTIDHGLTRKYPFYTPDNADRYYYETVVYYPPELEDVATEVYTSVDEGVMEPVEMLKDVVVVLGLEFSPRMSNRLGLDEEKPEVRIVISKTDFTLKVYNLMTAELLGEYPVTVGKNPDLSDKKEVGDNRTPEGTFKIVSIEDSSAWTYNGELAYGPWFLRLATPPWTGIGIHGTNEPEMLGAPGSRGCIRMDNDDLLKVVSMADVGTVVEIRH